MKRGAFFRILFLTLALCCAASRTRGADGPYFELRVYTTKSEQQQKLVSDYWQNAGVAAYNRLGCQPVGVFTELEDGPTNKIYVLIPFESAEAFAKVPEKLAADDVYQKASADFMSRVKADAPYVRFESSLLLAMDGMKKIVLPSSSAEKKPWIFELRTYLSPNEGKGINKVAMFNAGEIQIMQEVGLSPVFFAHTIVGPNMPCLIYMVSGEDKEKHQEHWKGFGPNPIWKKLSTDPQFKDNVSGSKNVFLKRTAASQI